MPAMPNGPPAKGIVFVADPPAGKAYLGTNVSEESATYRWVAGSEERKIERNKWMASIQRHRRHGITRGSAFSGVCRHK